MRLRDGFRRKRSDTPRSAKYRIAICQVDVEAADHRLTPYFLHPMPTLRRGRSAKVERHKKRLDRSYRTAGLCGLETSMEDFGSRISNAVTIWAFSSESDELPQVTVRPDSRTSAMASRLLAVIRSTLPRSLFGNAAATMAISVSRGLSPGSTTTASTTFRGSACRVWYATPDLSTNTEPSGRRTPKTGRRSSAT